MWPFSDNKEETRVQDTTTDADLREREDLDEYAQDKTYNFGSHHPHDTEEVNGSGTDPQEENTSWFFDL